MFRLANCKEQTDSGEPEQDKTEWEWEGGLEEPRAGLAPCGLGPAGGSLLCRCHLEMQDSV